MAVMSAIGINDTLLYQHNEVMVNSIVNQTIRFQNETGFGGIPNLGKDSMN